MLVEEAFGKAPCERDHEILLICEDVDPLDGIHFEQIGHNGIGQVHSFAVDCIRRRNETDWSRNRFAAAFTAIQYPFQHA